MVKKTLHIIFSISLCLFTLSVFGQSSLEFIENKGQWDSRIKFKGDMGGGAFFLENQGYRVVLHQPDDMRRLSEFAHGHADKGKLPSVNVTLRSHAYAMKFLGSNPNPVIIPDKQLSGLTNYFIDTDRSKWASGCRTFEGVTYKNIYPGVDARYYTDNGHAKYDLIVSPGADVSRIAMGFEGVDDLRVKEENLIIKTSVGEIRELYPYTYQSGAKGRVEVKCRFRVKNNQVSFELGEYNKDEVLVIDPVLLFSSFTRSTASNWGYTATYGGDGSFFGGGIVFGTGYPTSVGAYQTIFQGGVPTGGGSGGFDMGIIRLNAAGSSRLYATYLGGSNGNDQPHSMWADAAGNLVIAGRSNSSNYPITRPVVGSGGGYDIVVSRLSPNGGILLGSMRIGGGADDGVNINAWTAGGQGENSLKLFYGDDSRSEVIQDNAGNIYVASSTQSINFPVTPGASQPNSSGLQDGIILKIDPLVTTLTWATYFGGSGNDAVYVLAINPLNGILYAAGGTASNNLPGSTSGTISPANQGIIDGFVTFIDPNTSNIGKTTYIGTNAVDQVYGIQFDKKGFPYVMGATRGNWPVINAAFSNAGGKQFIGKMQPDLSAWIYSTRFGTNSTHPNISPVAFLVDRCENVYVSGWGGTLGISSFNSAGTNGLPITPDAIKNSTDGEDFYFFVLAKNAANQLYGSFFGQNGGEGEHVDGGTSRFDQNGVIYQAICANCFAGVSFPTTAGAYGEGNPAGTNYTGTNGCNQAMVKIAMNFAGVGSGVQPSINSVKYDSVGCLPLTVKFADTLANALSYEWDFGDGTFPFVVTTIPEVTHTYTRVGRFRVRLVSTDLSTCNERDTSFVTIIVRNDEAALDFNFVKLPPCDSFKYQFNNLSVPSPGKLFTDTSFIWDFGDGTPRVKGGLAPVFHRFPSAGTYQVSLQLVDSNFCNANDPPLIKTVRVSPFVKAQVNTPPSGCVPYTALFNNTSIGGVDFIWAVDNVVFSTQASPSFTFNTVGTYNITLIAIDTTSCNKTDTLRFTVTVNPKPVSDFNFSPIVPEVNTPVTFINNSSNAVRYLWKFGDGDSLFTIRRDTLVQHQYNATGNYNACLIAFNQFNCTDTLCRQVPAIVEPRLDVPNAFTPLSGDINSRIFVRGFGIGKMNWKIFNRWGQVVFESNNRFFGWDGRFKGAVQAMDVYAYTLMVEFTDGTKASKQGIITLLR